MWIFKLFGCNCSSSDRKLLCTEESGFQTNAAFEKAVPKYIVLAVVLVLVSAALPAYSQSFFVNIGISGSTCTYTCKCSEHSGSGSSQLSDYEILDYAEQIKMIVLYPDCLAVRVF